MCVRVCVATHTHFHGGLKRLTKIKRLHEAFKDRGWIVESAVVVVLYIAVTSVHRRRQMSDAAGR